MDQRRLKIDEALRTLLPVLDTPRGEAFLARVEGAPVEQLRRFYLFSASSTVLPDSAEDVQRFIEKRYLSLLSAAHRAGWTVLTTAVGSGSGVALHFGFMTAAGMGSSDPYVFERMHRGLLPGIDLQFQETRTVESFLTGKPFGGLIAAIPTLKIDDERQQFSLPSVLRSMHGEDYALVVMSRPVSDTELGEQIRALWAARDACHELAHRTRQTERGGGTSWHDDESVGSAHSETTTAGPHIIARIKTYYLSGTLSNSSQRTVSDGRTSGIGGEHHWSESFSQEEQDSLALELERLAQRHGDRLMKAANVGAWETAITFGTATSPGRDILAGVLLGELAKPSTDVFPPRAYYADLEGDCPLLLPGADGVSAVFPRSLASYLTSEELASIAAPPSENLPGYEIRRTPDLNLTDVRAPTAGWLLGSVCDHGRSLAGVDVRLGPTDLAKHLFVCGLTGSGKTTTVKEILAAVDVPFLVLESAKRDYRQLLAHDSLRDRMRVLTPGDPSVAPLRLNPFYILPGVSPGVHIDYLKAIFNASFSLYGPMPFIVERCLHNIYQKRGWDLDRGVHPLLHGPDGQPDERYAEDESLHYFPTLLDLRDEVQDYVRSRLDYRGELSDNIRTAIITRIESLAVGAKGLLFNSATPLDVAQLLAYPTVLELEALSDDDDKAFFVGLILTLISEFRQSSNPSLDPYAEKGSPLQHLLVVEEAHRLLKNVTQERQSEQLGNPRGKAVEFFANVISEMRSMGQGVAVVEQIPSKLLPDVIKNTNAKIVHRLVSRDDQALLASTLGLNENEAIYLTSLRTGHALYAREGMQRPIEIEVKPTVSSTRISHERVRRVMIPKTGSGADDSAAVMAVRNALGADGYALVTRLLCTLAYGEPSQCGDYASKAVNLANSRLLGRDRRMPESSIKRFLGTGIVELLTNGIFRLGDGLVRGVTPIVSKTLAGDEEACHEIQRRLAHGWGASDSRDGATIRLCKLVLDRMLRVRAALDDDDVLNRIVATYFISDIPDVRSNVVSQIVSKTGGAGWNR